MDTTPLIEELKAEALNQEDVYMFRGGKRYYCYRDDTLDTLITHTAHAVREATLKEQKDSLMGLVVKNCVGTNGRLWSVDMDSLERDLATLSTKEHETTT